MRRFTSIVRLPKPDWNRIPPIFVWSIFVLYFLVIPVIKRATDPSITSRPRATREQYRAAIDSAFAIRDRGIEAGLNYTVQDYARDMTTIRTLQYGVSEWIVGGSGSPPFDGIINGLLHHLKTAERVRIISRMQAANPRLNKELAIQLADGEMFREITTALSEYRTSIGETPLITRQSMIAFARHFALSNLWAMLATVLVLVIKLVVMRRLKEELILCPSRFLWSCFWWGYGVSNYPGNDVASEIRFIKLRNQHLATLERWTLTAQEEAALWLMARDRLVKFDEALESVRDLGVCALAQPRRTLLTTVLIWLSSSSLALRTSAADTMIVVEACQLAKVDVPELKLSSTPFTPMGGGDKLSPETNAFMPGLISSEMVRLVCLGAGILIVDQRKLIRAIRAKDCRAPPVISQEAHDEAVRRHHHAGRGAHGHLRFGRGSAR